MTKFLKTVLIIAYTYLLIQYLKNTLKMDTNIELDYITHLSSTAEKVQDHIESFQNNVTALEMDFKKPKRFATDLKYILKYTNSFLHYGTSLYKNGQIGFILSQCKYINCFITNNNNLLADIRNFDAVLFDIENGWDNFLKLRHPYQKFIFVASESSANYPLCDERYNNYYNLTWTYRLDSDIRWTYLTISDKQGNIVGPHINMSWIFPMKSTPAEVKEKLGTKKVAAAWFVSNCNAKNGRGAVTRAIERALDKYGLYVHIYGWCGTKTCPKERFDECLKLLETDYYFYLAFENSFAEDYVTEKILYPLQHYAVPIVYGGADYSRFLPPGSYIDAKKLNATQVAEEIFVAIKNPKIYENYFRWHNYYEYVQASKIPEICKLCEILNEQPNKHSTIKNLLYWWNPNYIKICNHGEGRIIIGNDNNVIDMETLDLDKEILDLE